MGAGPGVHGSGRGSVSHTKAQVTIVSTPVSPVLTDMKPRLEAAGREVTSTRDAHRAALEVRDELVITAVDHGMSQRAVAAAAGITVARVCAILVHGYPED